MSNTQLKFRRTFNSFSVAEITRLLFFAKKSPDKQSVNAESLNFKLKIRNAVRAGIEKVTGQTRIETDIKNLESSIGQVEQQLKQMRTQLSERKEDLKKINNSSLIKTTSKGFALFGDLLKNISISLDKNQNTKAEPNTKTTPSAKTASKTVEKTDMESLRKEYDRLQLMVSIKKMKDELGISDNSSADKK